MRSIGVMVMAVALFACGAEGDGNDGGAGPLCAAPRAVTCEDALFLDLNLQDEAAPGDITDESDAGAWISTVDATAGGFNANPPDAFVYATFTDGGLQKIDLDDESALTSMDWDIAFRRYIIRLNSGDSGPSCVTAALVPGATYPDLDSVPGGAIFRADEFYTDDCTFQNDASGLPGSPTTALNGYWSYPGCVQMTGNVYIVRRRDGRHVKLTVLGYYNQAAQEQCQEDDAVTLSPSGSGTMTLRWEFLD